MSNWTKSNIPPPNMRNVLLCDEFGYMSGGFYNQDDDHYRVWDMKREIFKKPRNIITYWCELPENPNDIYG